MFVRANELSNFLGVSPSTLWRWRKNGILPAPIHIGPRVVGWRIRDIKVWIETI
ncbi:MAG TPA: transcriptional regulator [Alteromonas macleodii]|nr:transcriptional regulator [Alteromonas macleodii]HAM17930.1 transcriptional regulator [Alteromonas macleodii]